MTCLFRGGNELPKKTNLKNLRNLLKGLNARIFLKYWRLIIVKKIMTKSLKHLQVQ